MLSASDLGGMMAMMPAFATDDAASIRATDTISVERLRSGLDRMVRDGANVIAKSKGLPGDGCRGGQGLTSAQPVVDHPYDLDRAVPGRMPVVAQGDADARGAGGFERPVGLLEVVFGQLDEHG